MTEADNTGTKELKVIDETNFRSDGIYLPIYEDFETAHWLKGKHQGTINDRTMCDVAYEKERCKEILRNHAKKPKWRKLLDIDRVLAGMSSGNLPPLLLKELIAPIFLKDFPNGSIWYVPVANLRNIELMKTEIELGNRYQPDFEGLAPPHPASGLDLELALRRTGVSIPLQFTFPFVMGINAPLAFGNFVFLTGSPIASWDHNTFSAQEMLSIGVSGVYTDGQTPSYGIKRPMLIDTYLGKGVFSCSEYFSYFRWYVTTVHKLYDFLMGLKSREDMFLASISISRIMTEAYLTVLSDVPLIRLMLAFAVLDKFANLSCELGYSKMTESRTWTSMLSSDFFNKSSAMLAQVPGLGQHFSLLNNGIQEELDGISREKSLEALRSDMTGSKLMRIYRNSYHGYLLHDDLDRKTLLSHSGDVFNEFADIVVLLWHAFVMDPQRFLTV